MTRSIFTITGGRTGTAWLGAFLEENLGRRVVHEPLGVDDFGTKMPDIRTMRRFNANGLDDVVQAFWARKLADVARHDFYAETNHTLAKCGLVEALARSPLAKDATLIVQRRDMVKQCVSYLVRNDFGNITIPWQWYLHPEYPKRLVTPKPFLPMGQLGQAIWYTYEMAARQTYYLRRYGDALNMIEVQLETAVQPEGAQAFWESLGGSGECALPPPRNQNDIKPPAELVEKIETIFSQITFDADVIVERSIKSGFTFEPPVGDAVRAAG